MQNRVFHNSLLLGVSIGALAGGVSAGAAAQQPPSMIDIPSQPVASALRELATETGVNVLFSPDSVRGMTAHRVSGQMTPDEAARRLVAGTPLQVVGDAGAIVVREAPAPVKVAQAEKKSATPPPPAPTLETVVVTAQKKEENIQTVPIAVTALSQQQLTERQVAGGPDLVKEVPDLTFSKTNFSGYNLEIRGIGTQAISVTTDPAVAVAFNDIPFIRNHFFEQEFYDLQDAEVLRGPQGTLYGRNATAGVVNIKSALPTDQYEAMLSADLGNYNNRRLEGMLNLPIVSDTLDLRIAGEWTKRDGYSFNSITDQPIDGRDLWSGRATLGWKPTSDMQVYLVWEHFSEDDDRLRSGKQLCETAPSPTEVNGVPVPSDPIIAYSPANYLSQGCQATSLYAKSAFEVPNGNSLPYYDGLGAIGIPIAAGDGNDFNPYASTTQSTNLRVIESTINPHYVAKNDTVELNADYRITPALTFTSQTGYNNDFLWSTEDYNRFNTAPGAFVYTTPVGIPYRTAIPTPNALGEIIPDPAAGTGNIPANAGIFCDPQLGCSDRLVAEDLSDEHAWQLSQEFRLASNFSGPLNFSVGGNFLHYETEENYYVFINTLSLAAYAWPHWELSAPYQSSPWVPGVSDNANCLLGGFMYSNPHASNKLADEGSSLCQYIDPNPLSSLNNEGHNYFLSQNPYVLNSYAGFGEVYYDIAKDLKLTGGLRWTEDQKHFTDIPSELLVPGYGYPVTGVVNQHWGELTGRAAVNWTPELDFTDQTLIYGSYAHGYKAGGANPPGAELLTYGSTGEISNPIHPLTFKPEFIEAFELGTKNTLLNGTLTLNGDIFYYNYTGYQISEIVDRTAINNNYNAHVEGAEVESTWEPMPGLKFNFAGGWEDTAAAGGDSGVDLMDRTAGNPNWMVVKPFVTQASNCILPTYVVAAILRGYQYYDEVGTDDGGMQGACGLAYTSHWDPLTGLPYVPNPSITCISRFCAEIAYPIPAGYQGFNPATAPNNGEGFSKNLSGHALPNAPPFTVSFGAQYGMPVTEDWLATLRADFYWQDDSWARIFNDNPYDKLGAYTNLNLALILDSANGWQVMAYVKNVFDVTAITGDFLNSDDSGLTTNVFLTDPRLYGVRVTKQLDQADGFWGSEYSGADFFTGLFSDTDNGKPPLWIDLGGQLSRLDDGQEAFAPPLMSARPSIFAPSQPFERPPLYSLDETAKISFEPDSSDWVLSAAIRYGRSQSKRDYHEQTVPGKLVEYYFTYERPNPTPVIKTSFHTREIAKFADTDVQNSEKHLVIDFQAGKDVGLGMFGIADGSSVVSAGVRIAQFTSRSNIVLKSDPDAHGVYFTFPRQTAHGGPDKVLRFANYHSNAAGLRAIRSFHGIGPSISWNASLPVAGGADTGKIDFDWGLNGALLFGRQRTLIHHQATAQYHSRFYSAGRSVVSQYSANPARSRMVTVPNIGGFAGISFKYQNAKVSFGYRADEFFGAMDGGIDSYKSENRGFFGPFAIISLGLGG